MTSHQQGVVALPHVPEFLPLPNEGGISSLGVSIIEGPTLSVWSETMVSHGETLGDYVLKLQPEQAVVVGRQNGGRIEYLDPNYHPTHMVPNSDQCVLTGHGHGRDNYVSRGHFTLKGSVHGVVLINGVPRRGGGIRPPVNGTWLLSPNRRQLEKEESYLIERGASAKIHLPNGTVLLLSAA